MKINLFKKENSFKKKDFQFNPNLFWEISIFFGILIFILSIFFGYGFFSEINKESEIPIGAVSAQVPKVNKEKISKVLNYFVDRENKSNSILSSPSLVSDPSK